VSLRGLGASATLTLINGRRASVSAFARGQESFIDVSSLPLAVVERVEVLPSGASAIYGADAVAGVINYVLRKDFEGLELSASYGDSTAKTDEGRASINLAAGKQFGNHHFMGVVDYYNRNAFYLRDRIRSRTSVRPSQQGIYPSFNDLFAMRLDQTEEPNDGGCPASTFKSGNLGEFCETDNNRFVSASDELESVGGLFAHTATFGGNITWSNQLLYSTSTSAGTGSPANFSRAPIDPENPNFPQTFKDELTAEARFSRFSSFNRFPIFMWGKLPQSRAVEVESTSFRATSVLEFELQNGWKLEAGLLYGGNNREQNGTTGLVKSKAFYDTNLGNLCSDGSIVRRWDVDLRRPSARYFGTTCESQGKTTLWYNPFKAQENQAPGVKEAIETKAKREGESRISQIDFSANGDLFNLGGRMVKGAFGIEFRQETLNDTPSGDAIATSLNPEPILGFSSTSAIGERNQWSAYGELYVPITDRFDVQLAGRYDNYDDFGSDFNPKIALRWQPIDSIGFRANYSTSFRAPSLAQSGAGVLLSSYRVSCLKVPAACNNNAAGSGQSLLSEDVGNLDLKAENATSFGAGFIFKPNRDFEFRLDYWNIEHEDLVGIDEDDFIRRALAGGFPVVGPGLLPTGTPGVEVTNGFVSDAHFQITNLGYQKTDGIDVSLTYFLPKMDIGQFSFLFDASYLINFDRQASAGSVVEKLAGDYRYPQTSMSTKLRWRNQAWRASLTAKYTGEYLDDPAPRTLETLGLPLNADISVKPAVTFDGSVGYDVSKHLSLNLSVRNILDAKPPLVLGSSSNVDLFNHDLIGRFVTLRATYSF
jgi:outer membrane receptor protein involved in Fe transport